MVYMSKQLELVVKFFRRLQAAVDHVGMYRAVSGNLVLLALCSVVFSLFGWVAYGPIPQLLAVTSGIVLAIGLNILLARIKRLPANHESAVTSSKA